MGSDGTKIYYMISFDDSFYGLGDYLGGELIENIPAIERL